MEVFQSFCLCFCDMALWAAFTASSINKLRPFYDAIINVLNSYISATGN